MDMYLPNILAKMNLSRFTSTSALQATSNWMLPGLHELYKQRSINEFCDERDQSKLVLNWRAKKQNLQSETFIEQVKSHTMAGSTLE